MAVEMWNREKGCGVCGDHRLLFPEIRDANREDRSFWWRRIAESPQVSLAERPLLREAFTADEPGPVAVPLAFGHFGQRRCHLRGGVDRHHVCTVPSGLVNVSPTIRETHS
jgi:hypothetical protein